MIETFVFVAPKRGCLASIIYERNPSIVLSLRHDLFDVTVGNIEILFFVQSVVIPQIHFLELVFVPLMLNLLSLIAFNDRF